MNLVVLGGDCAAELGTVVGRQHRHDTTSLPYFDRRDQPHHGESDGATLRAFLDRFVSALAAR